MAHYLVTGGCGFIGSHLCQTLIAQGHQVTIIDNLSTGSLRNAARGSRLFAVDLLDAEAVREAMLYMDGVFHLAAAPSAEEDGQAWIRTHAANQTATVTVLETARRCGGIPVVYASSAAVYGDNDGLPLAESGRLRPRTACGADKLGSELHARVAQTVHGIRTVGFRLFDVYGPREDPTLPSSGLIAAFADRLTRGEPITLPGDGLQVRDFVHVGDVVRFLIAGMASRNTEARVYNVCTGRPTKVLHLVRTMAELLGTTADLRFAPPSDSEIRCLLGDPSRAAAELHTTARTDLNTGLASTLGVNPILELAGAA